MRRETLKPEVIDKGLEIVDGWLDMYKLCHPEIPGIGIAIANGEEVIYERTFGFADLAIGKSLAERYSGSRSCPWVVPFHSHAKALTTVMTMQLVSEGALRLEDEVSKHLGWLDGHPLGTDRLEDLLSGGSQQEHSAQDAYQWQQEDEPFPDAEQLKEIILSSTPRDPGRFAYSNNAMAAMGAALEQVTGKSYAQCARERVIGRLGLEGAMWAGWSPDIPDKFIPSGHTASLEGVIYVLPDAGRKPSNAFIPAQGLHATPAAMCRFMAALRKPDPLIGDEKLWRMLVRPSWAIDRDKDEFYSYGLMHWLNGGWRFGHVGAGKGFKSCTQAADNDITVSIFNNTSGVSPVGVVSGVHGVFDYLKNNLCSRPDTKLDKYAGTFFASLGTGMMKLLSLGDKLVRINPISHDPFGEARLLVPASEDNRPDTFYVRGNPMLQGPTVPFTFNGLDEVVDEELIKYYRRGIPFSRSGIDRAVRLDYATHA